MIATIRSGLLEDHTVRCGTPEAGRRGILGQQRGAVFAGFQVHAVGVGKIVFAGEVFLKTFEIGSERRGPSSLVGGAGVVHLHRAGASKESAAPGRAIGHVNRDQPKGHQGYRHRAEGPDQDFGEE